MNQKEALQPKDIETRIEVIQIMWLKKYLAPKSKRPDQVYVVDQIIFNNLSKIPKIAKKQLDKLDISIME